jgi:formylglycine-generating enzyme required for sulfatase activity
MRTSALITTLVVALNGAAIAGLDAQTAQGGNVFRDCSVCSEMVVIPAGSFLMGSSPAETERDIGAMPSDENETDKRTFTSEHPQHTVTIARRFAMGRYFVTRGEFAAFVKETGYSTDGGCTVFTNHRYPLRPEAGWRAPGFAQTDRDPVVCVNWYDAQAYIGWLDKKVRAQISAAATVGRYRLPSEAEWEYAARASTQTVRWWGDSIGKGNADCEGCGSRWDDRQPAPVGSFPANPFGLFEMLGSAWEWTEDCWNKDYVGAPGDGSAWMAGGLCDQAHAIRGGSFASRPWLLRPAKRTFMSSSMRANLISFRVAKILQ